MSLDSDINLFAGGQTSPSVKSMIKLAKSVDDQTFERTLKLCSCYLRNEPVNYVDYSVAKKSSNLKANEYDWLWSGLVELTTQCLRLPMTVKAETLRNELVQHLKLSPSQVSLLEQQVFGRVSTALLARRTVRLPRCNSLRWRIDVVISNRTLSRVMEPVIVFELTTTEKPNEKVAFECKLKQFHVLRFAVAGVLREIALLETKSVIKS